MIVATGATAAMSISPTLDRHSKNYLPNLKTIISSHNIKTTSNRNKTENATAEKNTKKTECPLEGKRLKTNVIYQATVETNTSTKTYVGLATSFKESYRNHKISFRHHIDI